MWIRRIDVIGILYLIIKLSSKSNARLRIKLLIMLIIIKLLSKIHIRIIKENSFDMQRLIMLIKWWKSVLSFSVYQHELGYYWSIEVESDDREGPQKLNHYPDTNISVCFTGSLNHYGLNNDTIYLRYARAKALKI